MPAKKKSAAKKTYAKRTVRKVYKKKAMSMPKKETMVAAPKRQWARTAGSIIGGALGLSGGPGGLLLGAKIGSWAGGLFQKITGWGKYNIKRNSCMPNTMPPKMVGNGQSSFVFRHHEFVQDIQGTTAFTNTQFIINPLNTSLFPWLSQIAPNFEEYMIHGMIMAYRPTSGTAVSSTNTSLGTVVMATEYNSLATGFTNKQQMEDSEYSTSDVPFKAQLCPIECDPSVQTVTPMFVQQNSGGDARFSDWGIFQIGTVGMQSGVQTIGELHVMYEIQFFKPLLGSQFSSPSTPISQQWGTRFGLSSGTGFSTFNNLANWTSNTLPAPTLSQGSASYVTTFTLPASWPAGTYTWTLVGSVSSTAGTVFSNSIKLFTGTNTAVAKILSALPSSGGGPIAAAEYMGHGQYATDNDPNGVTTSIAVGTTNTLVFVLDSGGGTVSYNQLGGLSDAVFNCGAFWFTRLEPGTSIDSLPGVPTPFKRGPMVRQITTPTIEEEDTTVPPLVLNSAAPPGYKLVPL